MNDGTTRYGWPIERWDAAVAETTEILVQVAAQHRTISYGDLALEIRAIALADNPRARQALLCEISEAEDANGRGMLSVVVVNKTTGIPGKGFFTLARRLGREAVSDFKLWESEFASVCDHWSRRR